MIKKRLLGVITVLDGLAVQSIGYKKYLPLGNPAIIAQNLENWGVDEILIQSINRSSKKKGPDIELLRSLSKLSLSTPLIYGGGIYSFSDAIDSIKYGCERITVDFLIHKNPKILEDIALKIGCQALIASIPLSILNEKLYWFDYHEKSNKTNFDVLQMLATNNFVSEFLLIDKDNEGLPSSFNFDIYKLFPVKDKPIILFGGISEKLQMQRLLNEDNISSVAVGNFLNYKEHMIQKYKNDLNHSALRDAYFNNELY